MAILHDGYSGKTRLEIPASVANQWAEDVKDNGKLVKTSEGKLAFMFSVDCWIAMNSDECFGIGIHAGDLLVF